MTNVTVSVTGNIKTLEAVNKFLVALETIIPKFIGDVRVARGEDNIILVEADYRNEEEADQALEATSEISTNILVATGTWVVLLPIAAQS